MKTEVQKYKGGNYFASEIDLTSCKISTIRNEIAFTDKVTGASLSIDMTANEAEYLAHLIMTRVAARKLKGAA